MMAKRAITAQPDFEKIEPLINAKYWTWAELSRQSHLSLATILSLRSGRRKASFRTICFISQALGVDPEEIVK